MPLNKKVMDATGTHIIFEVRGLQAHLGCAELECLMREAASLAGATILNAFLHPFGQSFGVTGFLVLAESHISVHTWPEHDYAAFDVFMCGDTSPQAAVDHIAAFDPDSLLTQKTILRSAPELLSAALPSELSV